MIRFETACRRHEEMGRRLKLAVLLALGFAPLAACTPDTAETQFSWGVDEHLGGNTYRPVPPPVSHQAIAKTYIYDGDNYAILAPKPRPAYTPAKATPPVAAERLDSSVKFVWPASGKVISGFGSSSNGERNDGINIALPAGTPIKASASGTVSYSGDELKDYGNLLLIKHDGGFVTAYAHAEKLLVQRGDVVTKGQVIAYAGRTGDVSTPQLHFEIRHGTTPVNPDSLLTQRNS
jgi:murein DD-endopeptidase MepM/ murein hydrolase activator NlpD